MSLIPWSDSYKVGVRVIDNDHRELFDIVNGLADDLARDPASPKICVRLETLMRHAREHFPAEERFMVQAQYPGHAEQVEDHRRFMRTLQGFRERCYKEPDRLDTKALLDFLKDWVMAHVLKLDIEMIPYLRGDK